MDLDQNGIRKGVTVMMNFFRKDEKGFTLIEVVLVSVIIAILAAIALPKYLETRATSAAKTCDSNLQAIRTQIEQHTWTEGAPPTEGPAATQIGDFIDNRTYFPTGSDVSKACPGKVTDITPTALTTAYLYDDTPLTGGISCLIHLTN